MNTFFKFLILIWISGFSQQKDTINSYVIITYSYDVKNDSHKPREYHWIMPIDSIKTINMFSFYPLYINDFSNDDLLDCINKKDVDLFRMAPNENFILDKSKNEDIVEFKNLIALNKKEVQRINIIRNKKFKEKIIVYVTPIIGKFCSSRITEGSGEIINYYGNIYLPISNIKLNLDFYNTEKGKLALRLDYLSNKFINKIN